MSDTQTSTVATTEALPEAPGKIESTWTSFIPMILIFAVFYFLLIRPQEKRRKEQASLIGSVKKGEDVITSGGIYGKVTKVNDSESTVEVEIAPNTFVKLSKASIVDIISRKVEQPQKPEPVKKIEDSKKAETTKKVEPVKKVAPAKKLKK